MKKLLAIFATTLVLCSVAYAAATPSFTIRDQSGLTATFDATDSVCKWNNCSYEWRYYGDNTNRLGATLGFGKVVTFTFPKAGTYIVVLKQGETCSATSSKSCPGTTQRYIVVS